ncbi:hypothetical protein QBC46DRAFT_438883 [Diplogelasinospora grovesii]|uniref:Uncharacterized protein n=1 Tax=Diplogelasinospora grovesii TaxID=303347 RepID=A0AAN6N5I8_9PEZI|nr:hypothetical protein QBC46DRAFT_438883 [Diplogelasinospora grovesii]
MSKKKSNGVNRRKANNAGKAQDKRGQPQQPDRNQEDLQGMQSMQNSQQNQQSDKAGNQPGKTRQGKAKMAVRKAQLELPEGWVPLQKVTNKAPHRNGNKPASQNTKISAPKPWEIDSSYPQPQRRQQVLNFDYDGEWLSLQGRGKTVKEELKKELIRRRRANLPPIFPDVTEEQLEVIKGEYQAASEMKLFKLRVATHRIQYTPRLIFAAPLAVTEDSPNIDNAFIIFLGIPELANEVFEYMQPSIRDLTALAATCKRVAVGMAHSMELWDFQSGDYHTESFEDGGVRSTVLVTTPATAKIGRPQNLNPYSTDLGNTMKLMEAINKTSHSFRHVILDQIPYFCTKLFRMVVTAMPNLESITISRCLLLDVTKLPSLLDTIKECSPPGRYVKLDFFPYYFQGPNTHSSDRMGCYGVTHHEPTFHTPKAIIALILGCLDKAKKVGMDLLSDSSSFWTFVRKLPGPDPLWAYKARDAIITRDRRLAELGGSPGMKYWRDAAVEAFADNLMAAVSGDGVIVQTSPRTLITDRIDRFMGRDYRIGEYWRELHQCEVCSVTLPTSVFPTRGSCCWGCKMDEFVKSVEDSHLRYRQFPALKEWFKTSDSQHHLSNDLVQTLPEVVHNIHRCQGKKALKVAVDTDREWLYYLSKPMFTRKELPMANWGAPYSGPGGQKGSMARWRWANSPARRPSDHHRSGGRQCEHPCKHGLSIQEAIDPECGPERFEDFYRRWEWTEGETTVNMKADLVRFAKADKRKFTDQQVQDWVEVVKKSPRHRLHAARIEWREQNKRDQRLYRAQHSWTQEDISSMGTPGNLPFNLDKPHHKVDTEELKWGQSAGQIDQYW